MLMLKLKLFFQLFRKGSEIAEAGKWKNRQVSATMLGGVILVAIQLLGAFGVTIPVDSEAATALAGGIIVLVNTILTMLTSKRAGIGQAEQAPADVQPAIIKPTDIVPTLDNDQINDANEYAAVAKSTGIY